MSLVWQALPVYNQGGSLVRETKRAKVPGGWLVLVSVNAHTSVSASLTFYPDPEHAWDGHSLDDAEPKPLA